MHDNAAASAVSAAPGIAVSALHAFGVYLPPTINVLTGVYLVLQIGWFVYEKLIKQTAHHAQE